METTEYLENVGWGPWRLPGEDRILERAIAAVRATYSPGIGAATAQPPTPEPVDDLVLRQGTDNDSRDIRERANRLIALSPAALGDRPLTLSVDQPVAGADVRELQDRLVRLGYGDVPQTGIYDSATEKAVRRFQGQFGIYKDGVSGIVTVRVLELLEREGIQDVEKDVPKSLIRRIAWLVSRQQSGMIMVDPIYRESNSRSVENDLLTVVRAAVEESIRNTVHMQTAHSPGVSARDPQAYAAMANSIRAELLILLDVCNSRDDPVGIATFFFGDEDTRSDIGEPLARLLHEEVIRHTGASDSGVHEETSLILERAEAPTVRVQLGNLSDKTDRRRLLIDRQYPTLIADGISAGILRLYSFGSNFDESPRIVPGHLSRRSSESDKGVG